MILRAACLLFGCLILGGLTACSGTSAADPEAGELVQPPFAVRGEAEGLLLVWFDAEGPHTASRRSEIPEAHRDRVRVDDLGLRESERLDADHVYVADLTGEGEHPVRRHTRDRFEQWVEAASADEGTELAEASPDPAPSEGEVGADVVIYGASWCGACRSAAAYLREREVPFVERDIEREPGAREQMMRAAQAAGVRPSGIPVIDFRGQVIAGFDRDALDRAIGSRARPI